MSNKIQSVLIPSRRLSVFNMTKLVICVSFQCTLPWLTWFEGSGVEKFVEEGRC